MDECRDCEFKGYSPQVCMLHAKHCREMRGQERKPLPEAVKLGAKTVAGAGLGVAVVVFGSAAASLVGGAMVLHALLWKLGLGAGLAGGGVGFFRGLTGKKGTGVVKP